MTHPETPWPEIQDNYEKILSGIRPEYNFNLPKDVMQVTQYAWSDPKSETIAVAHHTKIFHLSRLALRPIVMNGLFIISPDSLANIVFDPHAHSIAYVEKVSLQHSSAKEQLAPTAAHHATLRTQLQLGADMKKQGVPSIRLMPRFSTPPK